MGFCHTLQDAACGLYFVRRAHRTLGVGSSELWLDRSGRGVRKRRTDNQVDAHASTHDSTRVLFQLRQVPVANAIPMERGGARQPELVVLETGGERLQPVFERIERRFRSETL